MELFLYYYSTICIPKSNFLVYADSHSIFRARSKWNSLCFRHAPLFEDIGGEFNIPLVANAKSVREFDEGLTRGL